MKMKTMPRTVNGMNEWMQIHIYGRFILILNTGIFLFLTLYNSSAYDVCSMCIRPLRICTFIVTNIALLLLLMLPPWLLWQLHNQSFRANLFGLKPLNYYYFFFVVLHSDQGINWAANETFVHIFFKFNNVLLNQIYNLV